MFPGPFHDSPEKETSQRRIHSAENKHRTASVRMMKIQRPWGALSDNSNSISSLSFYKNHCRNSKYIKNEPLVEPFCHHHPSSGAATHHHHASRAPRRRTPFAAHRCKPLRAIVRRRLPAARCAAHRAARHPPPPVSFTGKFIQCLFQVSPYPIICFVESADLHPCLSSPSLPS